MFSGCMMRLSLYSPQPFTAAYPISSTSGLIALNAEHIELGDDDERAEQRAENAETLPVPVKHAQRFAHERLRAEPADRRAEEHGKEQNCYSRRSAVVPGGIGADIEYSFEDQQRHAEPRPRRQAPSGK